MADHKVRVFNVGNRAFLEVTEDETGKKIDLRPGRSLELPAGQAMSLMKAYPREIKSGEAVADDPRSDLSARERAIAKREAEVEAKERELASNRPGLESMTKDELIAYANEHDIDIDPTAKKADILEAVQVQGE